MGSSMKMPLSTKLRIRLGQKMPKIDDVSFLKVFVILPSVDDRPFAGAFSAVGENFCNI